MARRAAERRDPSALLSPPRIPIREGTIQRPEKPKSTGRNACATNGEKSGHDPMGVGTGVLCPYELEGDWASPTEIGGKVLIETGYATKT